VSNQVRLDRFEEWFNARKARQLAGRAGFTQSDVEDIAQDIRLDVLRRLRRFDPTKSNRHTFVAMIVRRCTASILERQCAEKRNRGRRPQSLDATISDAEGREIQFHQLLGPGSEDDRTDLIVDVRGVVDSLPEELRTWCPVFAEMSVREAARKHSVPRSRLQRIKIQIRTAFEQAGLADYLQEG